MFLGFPRILVYANTIMRSRVGYQVDLAFRRILLESLMSSYEFVES